MIDIPARASPAEGDLSRRGTLHVLAQTVDVMHARLGATTRQLAHEITHGVHPTRARSVLQEVAAELRRTAQEVPTVGDRLNSLAVQVESASLVGIPPRGHQFAATAQVLLHSGSIARNESALYDDPLDVPLEERGLLEALVDDIARVRTDLDALEPEVFDLLVAQGYFVADAYLKIGIPGVVRDCCGGRPLNDPHLRPAWDWAQKVIASANAHPEHTATVLRAACRSSKLWGRCETIGLRIQLGGFAALAFVMSLVVMAAAFWGLVQGGIRLWDAL